MASQNPIVHPVEVEWEFFGKTYVQDELTIEGEIRLAQVIGACATQLVEQGFPVARLADVVTDTDQIDIKLGLDLAVQALGSVPTLAVDSTLVMLGVFPRHDNGSLNEEYDELRVKLRSAKGGLKASQWAEMLEVFAKQNDMRRLTAPFVRALTAAMNYGMRMNPQIESPASLPPSTSSPAKATARPKKSSGTTR